MRIITNSPPPHSNVHSFLPVLLLFQYPLLFIIANSLYQESKIEEADKKIKDIQSQIDSTYKKIENTKVEINDLPNEGADLLHREYKIILADGESIHIDYHSKDKCRVFQINPDRSVISVKCSQPELNFDV